MLLSPLFYRYYCTWELYVFPLGTQVTYVQVALLTGKCSGPVRLTIGVHFVCSSQGDSLQLSHPRSFGIALSAPKVPCFAGADIKNMYFETPLGRFECMKMPIALIPADIIAHTNLNKKVLDKYVYMEIRKGMYGLPQAEIFTNKLLKKHLAFHGYFNQPHTPG
jgi:hypothetical protein